MLMDPEGVRTFLRVLGEYNADALLRFYLDAGFYKRLTSTSDLERKAQAMLAEYASSVLTASESDDIRTRISRSDFVDLFLVSQLRVFDLLERDWYPKVCE